jgi:hypothetical protein
MRQEALNEANGDHFFYWLNRITPDACLFPIELIGMEMDRNRVTNIRQEFLNTKMFKDFI